MDKGSLDLVDKVIFEEKERKKSKLLNYNEL